MSHFNRYKLKLDSVRRIYYKKLERKNSNLSSVQKIFNNESPSVDCTTSSSKSSKVRLNDAGIQMINENTREYLFGKKKTIDEEKIEKAKKHLKAFGLLDKNRETVNDVTDKIKLPKLLGENIDEHFRTIGHKYTDRYVKIISMLTSVEKLPEMPSKFNFEPGWTK